MFRSAKVSKLHGYLQNRIPASDQEGDHCGRVRVRIVGTEVREERVI